MLRVDPSLVVRARISLLRACIRSFVSSHSCMRRTHSLRRIHPGALLIHALHSLMRCTHSSLFTYQLCMFYICLCVVLIHVFHSFMRHPCPCVAPQSSIRCTHFMYHTHSMMCCTYSYIVLIHVLPLFMHYVMSVFSCISHASRILQPFYPVFKK